jgi:hypothetical protein
VVANNNELSKVILSSLYDNVAHISMFTLFVSKNIFKSIPVYSIFRGMVNSVDKTLQSFKYDSEQSGVHSRDAEVLAL